jgi:hypothetical protein
MLFVHETHKLAGHAEDAFDAHLLERLLPALAEGDDARLAWVLRLTHGSGRSYELTTLTAVADGAAYGRLLERFQTGDLRAWAADADRLRHEASGKVLLGVPWSPLDVAFDTIPTDGREGTPALFMEDTAWPYEGKLDEYLDRARTHYAPSIATNDARSLLDLVAVFQAGWGSPTRREVVLWQRITHPDRLIGLFSYDLPPRVRAPGTWMHDALEVRDDWRSRLLRTAPFSPLH